MATEFPADLIVRDYAGLITAIRAVKDFLQISDSDLENLAGLTRGHWSKIGGATPVKSMGPQILNAVLGALAIELVVKPDLATTERLAHRWPRRNEKQCRLLPALSEALLVRAASELGRRGRALQLARQAKRRNGNGVNGHARP